MPRSPTERAANADDVEDAKLFIEWLFSSDDNLHDLADIDKKTTLLLALPTVSGIELDFDTSQLMEEDLTKFGSAREATLAKWDKVTSGKEVVSSKWGGTGTCRPRGRRKVLAPLPAPRHILHSGRAHVGEQTEEE